MLNMLTPSVFIWIEDPTVWRIAVVKSIAKLLLGVVLLGAGGSNIVELVLLEFIASSFFNFIK